MRVQYTEFACCWTLSVKRASFRKDMMFSALGYHVEKPNEPVHRLAHMTLSSAESLSIRTIKPFDKESPHYQNDAFVVPKISSKLHDVQVDPCARAHVTLLQLAAYPNFATLGPVEKLLGAEIFACLFSGHHVGGDTGYPITLETMLGWVLMGKVNIVTQLVSTTCTEASVLDLEEVRKQNYVSPTDAACEPAFMSTHRRDWQVCCVFAS
ncbi:hypothetical protein PR048_005820 [Dryococelus australis]|uniref:Peptidase aspartic putative domain-containing protein n=1 Tax=Dryococelus australis TaxID=614101 RepID=A0ABQ9I994_9NEOP|nr:hypothetical protein PR048_005820 [Dryococelus australis]